MDSCQLIDIDLVDLRGSWKILEPFDLEHLVSY